MKPRDDVDRALEQWKAVRPDLDVSPMAVVARISRLARELERRLEPVFVRHGLEPGWFDVLATLRRSGPPHRLRAGEFTEALMLTSSGTTKRLDRLEEVGLIARERDPSDRRGIVIVLTRRGRALVDEVVVEHVENERAILDGLSSPQRRRLADLLRSLQLALPPATPDEAPSTAGADRRRGETRRH